MHDQLTRHLHKLSVEIGCRPIGSAANRAAAEYIQDTLRSAGLAVEEQPYPCTGWDCRGAWLTFDGEEYLPIGDDEYVRRAGQESFAHIALAINMDGIGYGGGANTAAPFNLAPGQASRLGAIVARYPAVQWVEPWPQSNHSTFAMRGMPALAFSSTGAFALAHFAHDTVEQVSIDKLAELVQLIREIVLD